MPRQKKFPESIQKAIDYAEEALVGKKRKDGFPVILHGLNVFKVIWESPREFTEAEYVATILHNVMNYGGKTFEDIKHLFVDDVEMGRDVAGLIKLLTRPDKISLEVYYIATRSMCPTIISIRLADMICDLESCNVRALGSQWVFDFSSKIYEYGIELVKVLRCHGENWFGFADWSDNKIKNLVEYNKKCCSANGWVEAQPFSDVIIKALDYAEKKHYKDRRKDGYPYLMHPVGVFKIMWDSPWIFTDAEYASVILHDVIEDCKVCFEDIMNLFDDKKVGDIVAGLVWLLSNDSDDYEVYISMVCRCSPVVIAGKLCDMDHNLMCCDKQVLNSAWVDKFKGKISLYYLKMIKVIKCHGDCWHPFADWIEQRIASRL